MPTRTPEKARLEEKWLQKFNKKRPICKVVFQQEAPVKESQELGVAIDGTGSWRDGWTERIQKFLVFASKTKISERLKIKTSKVKRKFAPAGK